MTCILSTVSVTNTTGRPVVSSLTDTGASKGTPGDAKCVTEILGGQKIRKLGGGQSLKLLPPDVIF